MVIGILNRINIPPLQCTALGAAAGFYFIFHTHLAVIILFFSVFLLLICFTEVLYSLFADSRKLRLTYICMISFVVGLSIGLFAADLGRNEVNFGIRKENVIAVEAVLLEDPRVISGGSVMAPVSLRRSAGEGGLRVSAKGEMTIFFPPQNADRLKQYGRGVVVFAEGSIRSSRHGYSLSANSLHIVKPAPAIEQLRTGIRLNLVNRFNDQKWGGLSLALLFGVRDNLDTELTSLYRDAGLSYILALSGMHLAILAAVISFLLKKPLGLKGCAIAGAFLIILYCLFVGPMPSLYRAGLMYILGVITILGALPKQTMSILSLSFLIQIIITPVAGNSLSFILSYVALLGILITGLTLSSLLAGKIPDFILQPLSISIGAFLATAGICSFTFGFIAPVGIIAGLVIVPLTTIFMIGSIIWLVLDFISLSFLLDLPLQFLYRLMEITASLSGNVPGITANPVLVLVLSISVILLIAILEQKRRKTLYQIQPFF